MSRLRQHPGVRYPEREVNGILKRYPPACATLRRELIASQLMQRADGIYWRVAAPRA